MQHRGNMIKLIVTSKQQKPYKAVISMPIRFRLIDASSTRKMSFRAVKFTIVNEQRRKEI